KPLHLRAFTATSCLGRGLAATRATLHAGRSGLTLCAFETVTLETYVGEVPGLEEAPLPAGLAAYACRNNRRAGLRVAQDGFDAALGECAARVGPARLGIFLGTSTSGILETEIAYRARDPQTGALPEPFRYRGAHDCYSVAAYVREALALTGPAVVISSACSSSAKVFASAQRAIAAGVVDAALVGGVDTLCLTTLYGFHALQLVASGPCRPSDVARDGISIAEAAAFALLEPAADSLDADAVLLLGAGESSDAYHMSSPHPEGRGARQAMLAALAA